MEGQHHTHEHHHYHHYDNHDEIVELLNQILKNQHKMANELSDLTAKVDKNTEVEASAVVLLQGLKAALDAAIASGDPAALQALSDKLGKSTDDLAAAVVANTPASTGG